MITQTRFEELLKEKATIISDKFGEIKLNNKNIKTIKWLGKRGAPTFWYNQKHANGIRSIEILPLNSLREKA